MFKRMILAITMIILMVGVMAQSYYNLRYTWKEIEDAITAVRDSIPQQIAGKLDANVRGIVLTDNPGVPVLVNLRIWGSPENTEHGYIFAVDSVSVIRVAAHTSDGNDTDRYSVAIGPTEADEDYTLTVAGPAIASRWDVAGADFAEYFEADASLGLGISVVLDNGRVRQAAKGEIPIGITSAGAGFVGNSGRPANQYLTTALGDTIWTEVEYVKVTREVGFPVFKSVEVWVPADKISDIPKDAEREIRMVAEKNPDYGKAYMPHRKNPAMVLVGLVGQIPLRKGQEKHPNWFYIKDLDKDTELWLVK